MKMSQMNLIYTLDYTSVIYSACDCVPFYGCFLSFWGHLVRSSETKGPPKQLTSIFISSFSVAHQ